MCGINLIIDKKNLIGPEPINLMTAAIRHRGPQHSDVLQILASSTIYLGHNRLKIIDAGTAANQPFVSNCGRYYLIYNGEIYNYQELRNDLLDRGTSFKTYSDTEVLFQLLIIHGVSALPMLQGMFSLIFFDKEHSEVILARDENGIKPLYYYSDENFFIASSETKSIFASGLTTKKLNESQINHYLAFKFTKAPETFFKSIFHVMPGEVILIDSKNRLKAESFVTQIEEVKYQKLNNDEILEKTEELLVDSISKHLYSDVPCGIFLSGGVDSTLILALIKEHGLYMIPSFSIVHKREEGSFGTQDYKYAKKAAAQYQSYQYEFEVGIDDLKLFDDFILDMDQPIGDSAAFLTYKLSCEAKKKVGVVLSGAGADELFAGYHRHHAFKWYLNNYTLLEKVSPVLKYFLPVFPTGRNHPFRKKMQLTNKFIRNLSKSPGETYKNFCSLNIIPKPEVSSDTAFSEPKYIEENLKAALLYDQKNYLISDVLALTDQTSMTWGLEVRVPYLDKKLMSFINGIPAKVIFDKGRKWILNELLTKYGGEAYVKRGKEGMGLPFGNWIKMKAGIEALKYLRQKNAIIYRYVNEEIIHKLLEDHNKGKADNTLEIWSILVLEAWLQKEFKQEFKN